MLVYEVGAIRPAKSTSSPEILCDTGKGDATALKMAQVFNQTDQETRQEIGMEGLARRFFYLPPARADMWRLSQKVRGCGTKKSTSESLNERLRVPRPIRAATRSVASVGPAPVWLRSG